jgi:uncharacterized phage infection (PIP) family protein YhgE
MTAALSLRENPDVMKLLESMKTPRLKSHQQGFLALLEYTDALTNQYNSILDELSGLKERIGGIADKKSPLANMVEKLDTLTTDVGEKLNSFKNGITSFCKDALEAIKDKGLSALDKVFSVLHVKDGLQAMSKACAKTLESLDKAVARCDSLEKHCQERASANVNAETPTTDQRTNLSDLLGDTRLDFENLSQEELKTVYEKFLAIGMDNGLTANENTCLQSLTEDVEALLPDRGDRDNAEVTRELELEHDDEI